MDSFLLHADNVISANRPAALTKTSDLTFKFILLDRLIKNKLEKSSMIGLSKRFFTWKLASKCFGEQLQQTINNIQGGISLPFSMTSSI